jgi:23S rRNA (cytosine1962-C5)-methyltransferase
MPQKLLTFDLPASLQSSLSRGHPWVYRNQLRASVELPTGSWVRVRCGTFTAYGLWDATNPIAVRLFSVRGVPDAEWVGDRVAEAWNLRGPVRATHTSAYRWIYGEGDGLPGIVVDLYGEYAVVRTYVDSVARLVPWVTEALHAHARLQGILWRPPGGELASTWGRLPPSDLTVEEHGLLFYADLFIGQKTGLYLDQRENRRALADWCQGKTVLDCFCYVGAFSAYALRAGAASILAVDAAAGAVEAAQRNFALNDLATHKVDMLVGDGFELLAQFAHEDQYFDIVVLDPPSFAQSRKNRQAAERAYVRLNRLALGCVKEGGLLASASCTSQVSGRAFHQALAEAARQAGRRLLIVHEAGQPIDHPVPAHFPEGRYLKFVISRALALA